MGIHVGDGDRDGGSHGWVWRGLKTVTVWHALSDEVAKLVVEGCEHHGPAVWAFEFGDDEAVGSAGPSDLSKAKHSSEPGDRFLGPLVAEVRIDRGPTTFTRCGHDISLSLRPVPCLALPAGITAGVGR